mmetsp:Transcript_52388/g.168784  ORF Transcript_52388/g.168784 Transcript_52388/m.168784 type:complete len:352 (-) Transcript_52388:45-1100(-)
MERPPGPATRHALAARLPPPRVQRVSRTPGRTLYRSTSRGERPARRASLALTRAGAGVRLAAWLAAQRAVHVEGGRRRIADAARTHARRLAGSLRLGAVLELARRLEREEAAEARDEDGEEEREDEQPRQEVALNHQLDARLARAEAAAGRLERQLRAGDERAVVARGGARHVPADAVHRLVVRRQVCRSVLDEEQVGGAVGQDLGVGAQVRLHLIWAQPRRLLEDARPAGRARREGRSQRRGCAVHQALHVAQLAALEADVLRAEPLEQKDQLHLRQPCAARRLRREQRRALVAWLPQQRSDGDLQVLAAHRVQVLCASSEAEALGTPHQGWRVGDAGGVELRDREQGGR